MRYGCIIHAYIKKNTTDMGNTGHTIRLSNCKKKVNLGFLISWISTNNFRSNAFIYSFHDKIHSYETQTTCLSIYPFHWSREKQSSNSFTEFDKRIINICIWQNVMKPCLQSLLERRCTDVYLICFTSINWKIFLESR